MRPITHRVLLACTFAASIWSTQAAYADNIFNQINQSLDKAQQIQQDGRRDVDAIKNHHPDDNHSNAGSCRNENSLRSTQGTQRTTVRFVNNTDHEVRTYWIDYNGRRVFYKKIKPHGNYTQPTFQSHPWVITDERDNCMEVFVSQQPSAVVNIGGGGSSEPEACHNENGLRSAQGNEHTSIRFVNDSNHEIRTYWLDYNGHRVFYKSIPPRGNYTQPTFKTHPWVITDEHDKCLQVFISEEKSAVVSIRR